MSLEYVQQACATLGSRCPEVIESAVLVHRNPDTGGGGLKRLFGSKSVASRLNTNNLLVLTPTALRLYGLGSRTGTKVKDEIAVWPRQGVRIDATLEHRHTHYVSYGTSTEQRVHSLHLTGPELDLRVDVMADAGLDVSELGMLDPDALAGESDPDVREGMEGLQQTTAELNALVYAFVAGTGGTWTGGA
jgi:hypothetical protein